jgi:YnbE-like lipoprotein
MRARGAVWFAGAALVAAACEPTVRVEAPREPITINLNIKADVRLRIEQQAEKDIETHKEIF